MEYLDQHMEIMTYHLNMKLFNRLISNNWKFVIDLMIKLLLPDVISEAGSSPPVSLSSVRFCFEELREYFSSLVSQEIITKSLKDNGMFLTCLLQLCTHSKSQLIDMFNQQKFANDRWITQDHLERLILSRCSSEDERSGTLLQLRRKAGKKDSVESD